MCISPNLLSVSHAVIDHLSIILCTDNSRQLPTLGDIVRHHVYHSDAFYRQNAGRQSYEAQFCGMACIRRKRSAANFIVSILHWHGKLMSFGGCKVIYSPYSDVIHERNQLDRLQVLALVRRKQRRVFDYRLRHGMRYAREDLTLAFPSFWRNQ